MSKKNNNTQNIVKNLEQTIFPALNSIRRKIAPTQQRQIDAIKNSLRKIMSDFGSNISSDEWKLSRREIEVCNLIKDDMSSIEIADLLCTSNRTIDNHRNNIRKKLGISNATISLNWHLKSLE